MSFVSDFCHPNLNLSPHACGNDFIFYVSTVNGSFGTLLGLLGLIKYIWSYCFHPNPILNDAEMDEKKGRVEVPFLRRAKQFSQILVVLAYFIRGFSVILIAAGITSPSKPGQPMYPEIFLLTFLFFIEGANKFTLKGYFTIIRKEQRFNDANNQGSKKTLVHWVVQNHDLLLIVWQGALFVMMAISLYFILGTIALKEFIVIRSAVYCVLCASFVLNGLFLIAFQMLLESMLLNKKGGKGSESMNNGTPIDVTVDPGRKMPHFELGKDEVSVIVQTVSPATANPGASNSTSGPIINNRVSEVLKTCRAMAISSSIQYIVFGSTLAIFSAWLDFALEKNPYYQVFVVCTDALSAYPVLTDVLNVCACLGAGRKKSVLKGKKDQGGAANLKSLATATENNPSMRAHGTFIDRFVI